MEPPAAAVDKSSDDSLGSRCLGWLQSSCLACLGHILAWLAYIVLIVRLMRRDDVDHAVDDNNDVQAWEGLRHILTQTRPSFIERPDWENLLLSSSRWMGMTMWIMMIILQIVVI